eukprot:1180931-Prorocentrum_minimum.AAC.1
MYFRSSAQICEAISSSRNWKPASVIAAPPPLVGVAISPARSKSSATRSRGFSCEEGQKGVRRGTEGGQNPSGAKVPKSRPVRRESTRK